MSLLAFAILYDFIVTKLHSLRGTHTADGTARYRTVPYVTVRCRAAPRGTALIELTYFHESTHTASGDVRCRAVLAVLIELSSIRTVESVIFAAVCRSSPCGAARQRTSPHCADQWRHVPIS